MTTPTLHEAAMRQALEALENIETYGQPDKLMPPAIEALRSALAQQVEQQPVAWRYKKEGGGWFVSDNEPQYVEQWNDIEEIQPLYAGAAPVAQPDTWTDDGGWTFP